MARTKKLEISVPFEDLLAFVQGKEDIATRIVKIKSTDPDAPESIRLSYSYPFVEKADQDGFEGASGEFVAYA